MRSLSGDGESMARILSSGTVLEDGPILVTGAGGFVGRHLMYQLEMGEGDFGTDLTADFVAPPGVVRLPWRLPDGEVPAALGPEIRYVVHLAGASSVAHSGLDAAGIYTANTSGTAAVLEWMARSCPGARLVMASSSDVYGSSSRGRIPETAALAPGSPYGGSKAAAETAAQQYRRSHGLDIVIARPFPHFGPWQAAHFAFPSFCRKLLEARRSGAESVTVGNLSAVRDYTFIGDVVEAYAVLLSKGMSGMAYNVCSGEGRSMAEAFETLRTMAGVSVSATPDDSLLRNNDVSVQIGDASRLTSLGWRRRYTFEEGLRILLGWWEDRI
ncbi:MAG: hypothetical protein AO396_06445 [Candidatus Fermentibacter daniensis]|nr:MAG: hypothetical protein AO396_06445 [Candidatus Fermentibacter daniensis]KZD16423.1 MAG: hypothetical protein AO395_04530 [Candidatus Fermentibacter daniensis]KZD18286.1 MAG: hypothetical protein AO394_03640 [Candidatus Fermentibacter daniensis]